MGSAFISCSSISGRDILCLSGGRGVLVTLILQEMGGIGFNFISSFIINYRSRSSFFYELYKSIGIDKSNKKVVFE